MVREIVRPQKKEYQLQIPTRYLNRRVEILVLPLSSNESFGRDIKKKRLEFLKNGPTYSQKSIETWMSTIERGYENWEVEEF